MLDLVIINYYKMYKNDKNIFFGISGKTDGDMKLDHGNDGRNRLNRQRFFARNGVDYSAVAAVRQEHGSKVRVVGREDAGRILEAADGLVTSEPNVVLSITVADCVPLYFYDRASRVIGLAHAGWRGIRQGIVENMAKKLQELGADIKQLQVFIGPHIRDCHYEVQEDVGRYFRHIPGALSERQGRMFLSLTTAIKHGLAGHGILEDNIKEAGECTFCLDKYYSYRRDQPEVVRVMVCWLGA